jgi:hypothetical protein
MVLGLHPPTFRGCRDADTVGLAIRGGRHSPKPETLPVGFGTHHFNLVDATSFKQSDPSVRSIATGTLAGRSVSGKSYVASLVDDYDH